MDRQVSTKAKRRSVAKSFQKKGLTKKSNLTKRQSQNTKARKVAKQTKRNGYLSKREIEQHILGYRENGRKLARSLLRRWRVRMPSEETDSIVDLTLCEAAKRYSRIHGASFMTFFFYHLRGYLVRAVAGAAKANTFLVSYARNANIDVGDWTLPRESGSSYLVPDYAMVGHYEVELPEEILIRRENIQLCRNACDQLGELEREVLTRLFSDDQALVDIARSMGYSRCHVSRVKKKALERLKKLIRSSSDKPEFSRQAQLVSEVEVSGSQGKVAKRTIGKHPSVQQIPFPQVAEEELELVQKAA